MKIYFVRHGESEANLLYEFSNRGFKHGLTDRGNQQAEYLAQSLRGNPFKRIYTSLLKRAFQTAKILARELNSLLEISDALREFDCGVLEGKSDAQGWEIHNRVFKQWLAGNWTERIPGGESHLDIQERFLPFIDDVIEKFSGESILMVGHGGLFGSVLPLIFTNLEYDSNLIYQIHHTTPIVAETRPEGLFCTQ